MADFDPDAYLKEKQAGAAFDPDAYLSEKGARGPAPEDAPGLGEALLHGYTQGFTKQWADELTGRLTQGAYSAGRALDLLPAAMNGPNGEIQPVADSSQVYAAARDNSRVAFKREADAHPVASFLSNVGGEIASDYAIGRLTGLPAGSHLYAAASGALSGAGAADDTTLGGTLGGAGIGAAAGTAGSLIGAKVVGPALSYVGKKALPLIRDAIPEVVREFAAKRALKAAGYIQKDIKPIARRDPELVTEKGQELLREGVVRFGRTVDDVAELAEGAKEKYGDAIGSVLGTADALGARFDIRPFIQRARKAILDPIKDDPAMATEAAKVAGLLDDYEKLPLGSVGFEKANQMKSNLQQQINWGNRWNDAKATPHNDNLIALQGIFLDEVDNQLGEAFKAAGAPGQKIRDAFKVIKSRYSIHADATDKARMGMARETGNEFISGKDAMIGNGLGGAGAAASMMLGNPLMAMGSMALGGAAALGNKVLRERGASAMAVGANKIASGIERVGNSAALRALLQTSPQSLGQYAPMLLKAAASGDRALAATHFVLSQREPEYRKQTEEALAQAER